jgi:hypothetical protein
VKLPAIGSTSDVPEAQPTGPTSPNQDRDTALDADARKGMPAPLPDAAPSIEGLELVDEAIAEGRAAAHRDIKPANVCLTCCGSGWVEDERPSNILGMSPCPSCGGVRASSR